MGSWLVGELRPPLTQEHDGATRGGCLGFRGWNQRLKQFVMIKNRLAFLSIKVALEGESVSL